MLLAGAIGLAMLWDISQAWLVWQDVQSMESALNQVQDRDRDLLKEAQQEGLDLSEAALQVLPKEIEFRQSPDREAEFFLDPVSDGVGAGHSSTHRRQQHSARSCQCHDHAHRFRPGAGRRDHPHRDLSRPSPIQGTGVGAASGDGHRISGVRPLVTLSEP
jgi:ABC-type nickel/cobalt efflux system permease component RcnA